MTRLVARLRFGVFARGFVGCARVKTLIAGALAGFAVGVMAQAAEPPRGTGSAAAAASASETLAPVAITGLRKGRLSYDRLLRMVAAYSKSRVVHAPAAELRFTVFDLAEPGRAALSMRYENDDRVLPIEVGADGRFDIPSRAVVGTNEGEVAVNRRSGLVGYDIIIDPWVRSPETTYERRRLGDLRVECEMFWAWRADDMNVISRAWQAARGGFCHIAPSDVGLPVGRRLLSAEIADGTRTAALRINDTRVHFYPPVADPSWPDDAVVTLTFEAPLN